LNHLFWLGADPARHVDWNSHRVGPRIPR
jgi:hypothetical protein